MPVSTALTELIRRKNCDPVCKPLPCSPAKAVRASKKRYENEVRLAPHTTPRPHGLWSDIGDCEDAPPQLGAALMVHLHERSKEKVPPPLVKFSATIEQQMEEQKHHAIFQNLAAAHVGAMPSGQAHRSRAFGIDLGEALTLEQQPVQVVQGSRNGSARSPGQLPPNIIRMIEHHKRSLEPKKEAVSSLIKLDGEAAEEMSEVSEERRGRNIVRSNGRSPSRSVRSTSSQSCRGQRGCSETQNKHDFLKQRQFAAARPTSLRRPCGSPKGHVKDPVRSDPPDTAERDVVGTSLLHGSLPERTAAEHTEALSNQSEAVEAELAPDQKSRVRFSNCEHDNSGSSVRLCLTNALDDNFVQGGSASSAEMNLTKEAAKLIGRSEAQTFLFPLELAEEANIAAPGQGSCGSPSQASRFDCIDRTQRHLQKQLTRAENKVEHSLHSERDTVSRALSSAATEDILSLGGNSHIDRIDRTQGQLQKQFGRPQIEVQHLPQPVREPVSEVPSSAAERDSLSCRVNRDSSLQQKGGLISQRGSILQTRGSTLLDQQQQERKSISVASDERSVPRTPRRSTVQSLTGRLPVAPASARADKLVKVPFDVIFCSSQREGSRYAASNLAGGTPGSVWESSGPPLQTLVLDTRQNHQVDGIILRCMGAKSDPKDVTLLHSSDQDGPWTIARRFFVNAGSRSRDVQAHEFVFQSGMTSRYWRLDINENWGAESAVLLLAPITLLAQPPVVENSLESVVRGSGISAVWDFYTKQQTSLTTFFDETQILSTEDQEVRSLARRHNMPLDFAEMVRDEFRKFATDRTLAYEDFSKLIHTMVVRSPTGRGASKCDFHVDLPESRVRSLWSELQTDDSVYFEEFLIWFHRMFYSDAGHLRKSQHSAREANTVTERFYAQLGRERLHHIVQRQYDHGEREYRALCRRMPKRRSTFNSEGFSS